MSENERTVRVALLTCASRRVNRDVALQVHRGAAAQVAHLAGELQVDYTSASVVGVADDEMALALSQIAQARPDLLILHYAGWTEDETVLKLIEGLGRPVMLWVTGDVFVNGVSQLVAHVGYMEAASFLKKMHKTFFRYYGGPDTESEAELRAVILAAKVRAELRRLRFGWIGEGYGSKGILDGTFNEDVLEKKLGVQFVRIALEEVFSLYGNVGSVDDPVQAEKLRSLSIDAAMLRRRLPQEARSVEASLRFLLALQQAVEEHELAALSLRCFPEFKEHDVPSPCLAISAMNQNGIPASCEGDVLAGVSMYVLSRLTGRPATLMDVFTYDEGANTMELFHCGSAAPALAGPGPCVEYRTHCKPGNHRPGVTVEFPIPPGKVSFLKLDMLDDHCKLFVFAGETVPPDRTLRGNQAVVRTSSPVKGLIERLLDHGASHHMILSPGNALREAQYVAGMVGLDLVRL